MLRSPHEPAGGGGAPRIAQIDDPKLQQTSSIAAGGTADATTMAVPASRPTIIPELKPKVAADVSPKRLFHYTDEQGLAGILESGSLKPSLKALNPKDARYGDGQYFTDIAPGTLNPRICHTDSLILWKSILRN